MQIVSDVRLNRVAIKRRRLLLGAPLLRLATAASAVFYVAKFFFTSSADFSDMPPFAVIAYCVTSAITPAFIPLEVALYGTSAFQRVLGLLEFFIILLISYLLIVLMSNRKVQVLYLRRFGLSAANRMITQAIEGGLGRRYRVLTLDDTDFQPLEVPRIERILSRIAIPCAVLILFLAVFSEIGGQGLGLPDAVTVRIIGWFGLGLMGELLRVPLFTLMVVGVIILIYRWRIRQSLKLEIRSVEHIHRCLIRVRRLGGWLRRPSIMAPQALVVKVVDSLWQQTVSELVEQISLVICDVSEPTSNLTWEVENISARPEVACVFVGNAPAVHSWVEQIFGADVETAASRMKRLLHGQTIVVFDPARRFAQRRFNRSLRNSLENVWNSHSVRQALARDESRGCGPCGLGNRPL